jgi:hypothetical protein
VGMAVFCREQENWELLQRMFLCWLFFSQTLVLQLATTANLKSK